jgi:hypothetical protein
MKIKKNSLNTTKDKIDVVLNIGNDEIIIVECKPVKKVVTINLALYLDT